MFEKYDSISIDKYIIMPNHIHGIINIIDNTVVGAIPCDCLDCNDDNQITMNDENAINDNAKTITDDERRRNDERRRGRPQIFIVAQHTGQPLHRML